MLTLEYICGDCSFRDILLSDNNMSNFIDIYTGVMK